MQGGVKKPAFSKGSIQLIDGAELIPIALGGNLAPPVLPINELGRRLLRASVDGNVEEIKWLMNRGAPFTSDWLGSSPLHFAAQHNYLDVCELLLKAGISKDAKTKVDRTPLHIAAAEGHLEVVKCLLRYKADIECRDLLEMTPLHWAVQNCHLDVVSFLVSEGAQVDAMSKFRLTPMEISIQCERYDILDILKSCVRDTMTAAENLAIQLNEMDYSNDSYSQNGLMRSETEEDSPVFLDSINLDDSENETLPMEDPDPPDDSVEEDRHLNSEIHNSCINDNEGLDSQLNVEPSEDSNKFTESLRLLQQHGITMLPADDTHILSSVIEFGRSVVLTDVGKEVLKSTKPVNTVTIGQPSKIQTLPINQKIITLSAEEFLAMHSKQNIHKQVNGKLPDIQSQPKLPIKRIIMKRNKVLPFNNHKVTKIFTTKHDNIMDVKTLVRELMDAKSLAEEYKQMYLQKHAEAERYKQQILMLTRNKS